MSDVEKKTIFSTDTRFLKHTPSKVARIKTYYFDGSQLLKHIIFTDD